MTTQLYTVTVTDLGTYQVTVAAASAKDAQFIAKEVLTEEATKLPGGMTIIKRELDATVVTTGEYSSVFTHRFSRPQACTAARAAAAWR